MSQFSESVVNLAVSYSYKLQSDLLVIHLSYTHHESIVLFKKYSDNRKWCHNSWNLSCIWQYFTATHHSLSIHFFFKLVMKVLTSSVPWRQEVMSKLWESCVSGGVLQLHAIDLLAAHSIFLYSWWKSCLCLYSGVRKWCHCRQNPWRCLAVAHYRPFSAHSVSLLHPFSLHYGSFVFVCTAKIQYNVISEFSDSFVCVAVYVIAVIEVFRVPVMNPPRWLHTVSVGNEIAYFRMFRVLVGIQ